MSSAQTHPNLLRRLTPKGLFWRSLLILLLPMVLLQGVVAYIFFERHWDTVSRRLALGVTGDIIHVMRTVQKYPKEEFSDWALRAAGREMQLRAIFEEGAALPATHPESSNSQMERSLRHALSERLTIPFHIDTQRPDRNISIRIQLQKGVLDILPPRKRMFSTTVYIFVLRMVGKGRTEIEFKPAGASEIRQAGAAFLDMRRRIARHIDQRTEMLAGVSHDLRTPLTRIKLQLAMLRETAPQAQVEISDLESDIADMERMIDEYLAFSRGQGAEATEPVDLSTIIGEVVEAARRNGGAVTLESSTALTLTLRPNALKRCLTNLVENALRHGNHVDITAQRIGEIVEVIVEDDGPGIPNESREEVFKPFFRLDDSRNPNYASAGLGLAIARDVARNHGGDIVLDDSNSGGLRATLRLPI